MQLKPKRKNLLIVIALTIVALFAFFTYQNNAITISEINYKNDKVPEAFNGYKILHISDLHNKEFGDKQSSILAKIKKINPDVIVITGDLIDSNRTNIDVSLDLINGAIDVAPIYYVSGNHEEHSGIYNQLKSRLEEAGVIVLDNKKTEVIKDDQSTEIIGLSDIAFNNGNNWLNGDLLNTLVEKNGTFKILLSHRPELFEIYSNSNADLVFSGHAHGGQVRIPFVGGLIAPEQGFFPELTEGIHTSNDTSIVISRGLGNSVVPVRIFNRPELIVVTLSN
ncbi:metallophosphoesterase [Bacillus sp. AGMB 02131]|uniref:Metallophosphoesterase n=1 Tax=Peribacillus faecalis TaxID=2772559 RepID=A0A927HBK0_9BACI|nr:metallophosphoesterase [Peribacillus faecalis]MBD3107483.1 metallophosphoesterase [Peribacillus faecalis]